MPLSVYGIANGKTELQHRRWRRSPEQKVNVSQTWKARIAHLATKADIGALDAKIESLRAELSTMKWIISIAIPAAIAITGILVGVVVQALNQRVG